MLILRKTISLVLIGALLLLLSGGLLACAGASDNQSGAPEDRAQSAEDAAPADDNSGAPDSAAETFGRNTVNYADMAYVRPNIRTACERIGEVTAMVRGGSTPESTLQALLPLESVFDGVETAVAMTAIALAADSADEEAGVEHAYLTGNLPLFYDAVDQLLDAVDESEFAEALKKNAFVNRLYSNYLDTNTKSEKIANLRKQELAQLDLYRALSPETVRITYGEATDTYANLLAAAEEEYRTGAIAYGGYLSRKTQLASLYTTAYREQLRTIYTNLVRIRRQMADDRKATSYAALAYARRTSDGWHDYSPEQFAQYLQIVRDRVLPICNKLENDFFAPYFDTQRTPTQSLSAEQMIYRLYGALCSEDTTLAEACRFMLRYRLYDIAEAEDGRANGLAVYNLPRYEAAFLFLTTEGNCLDDLSLANAIGRYFDCYVNGAANAPAELSDFYGDALALMAVLKMHGVIPAENETFLKYAALRNALGTVVEYALYGKFEELVYALPESKISPEAIDGCLAEAAAFFGLDADRFGDFAAILGERMIEEPFAEQGRSYAMLAALDLFRTAENDFSAGMKKFKAAVMRAGAFPTLTKALIDADLLRPLNADGVRALVNDVYFYLTGSYYYQTISDPSDI